MTQSWEEYLIVWDSSVKVNISLLGWYTRNIQNILYIDILKNQLYMLNGRPDLIVIYEEII